MGNKLYVGNLSYNVTEDSLMDAFSKFGSVVSARIITDRDSGRSKGFAFVEMQDEKAAQDAINEMNGREFEGRAMNLSEAKPMENRQGGGQGGQRSFNNRSRY